MDNDDGECPICGECFYKSNMEYIFDIVGLHCIYCGWTENEFNNKGEIYDDSDYVETNWYEA